MLNKLIAKQFALPKGLSGNIVGFFMNRQNKPMYEETIHMLSLSNAESILDIGCGSGYVLNMIAKQFECTFTGIDISETIIKAAIKRNYALVKSGKMLFFCHDMAAMPFEDESFSRVYTINTVYFWDSLPNTMREINRVMKPDGIFVNTLYSNKALDRFPHTKYGYQRFSEQQLTDAGLSSGFDVETRHILNKNAFCFIHRKRSERHET